MVSKLAIAFYNTGLESRTRRLVLMGLISATRRDGAFDVARATLGQAASLGERQMLRVLSALAEDQALDGLVRLGRPVIRPGGGHLVTGRLELPRLAPLIAAAEFEGAASAQLMADMGAAGLRGAAATPAHLAAAGRIVAAVAAHGV